MGIQIIMHVGLICRSLYTYSKHSWLATHRGEPLQLTVS